MSEPLGPSFFDRSVLQVAPNLLGCVISHGAVSVRLTEVEAYDGANDPGSHAYRGMTPRTAVMFGPPGSLYVYFTYGMHFCVNLVCGPQGQAAAVLLRAGEVVSGEGTARCRRGARHGVDWSGPARDLARGPARLAVCLGLGREQNGWVLSAPGCAVTVRSGEPASEEALRTGPRVGVAGPGGEGADFPWRFWVAGEHTVSTYRPAVSRRRR
nr:DNA-3-methyladenine glycosylase [Austwickia sp. TVS 96-490-7B]